MESQAISGTETTISLGSDLRIGRAAELLDALEALAVPAGIVQIDGSEVSKIDAAGLQVLVVVIAHFRTIGTVWRWHKSSATLISAAKMLGLDQTLELQ